MKKTIISIIAICVVIFLIFLGYKFIIKGEHKLNSNDNTEQVVNAGNNVSNNNTENTVNADSDISSNNSEQNPNTGNSESSINNNQQIGRTITTSTNNNFNINNNDQNTDLKNSNNKTIPQNTIREANNNEFNNYFGTWEVNKNVGHSIEGVTENATSLIGATLQITNNIYSFNGVTINNPYYYVQNMSTQNLFGQDGSIGVLQNEGTVNRLIISSKPLTSSEIQNMPLNMAINTLTPVIILNNSNIYVFGGGKNHAQIDSFAKE